VRPGRKIGHVNLAGTSTADVESVRRRAAVVAGIIRDGRVPAEEPPAIFEENA
jgi:5-(carboxyamino)imidazole ribonucleotide synthase